MAQEPSQRHDPIFITARFRSGSTLLWNIFRHIEGVTSYYEPFNERQWFNKTMRGAHVDTTHQYVSDYWREYDGLEVLQDFYDLAWIDKQLFMDASSWAPAMKRFVELLIEKAPGRPVLQFNRIDFRLPWFRHHFPHATIIHLYRHPRDQWYSSLMGSTQAPAATAMADFAPHDHFYLRRWARDLQYHFPFLDEASIEHPYQLFYYLWKLSYLFGVKYAHYSLAYEDLVSDSGACLSHLLSRVGMAQSHLGHLTQLIAKPSLGRWERYADADWFRHHESRCETTLASFLGLKA
jgi:LPS sulfotransferase NodH